MYKSNNNHHHCMHHRSNSMNDYYPCSNHNVNNRYNCCSSMNSLPLLTNRIHTPFNVHLNSNTISHPHLYHNNGIVYEKLQHNVNNPLRQIILPKLLRATYIPEGEFVHFPNETYLPLSQLNTYMQDTLQQPLDVNNIDINKEQKSDLGSKHKNYKYHKVKKRWRMIRALVHMISLYKMLHNYAHSSMNIKSNKLLHLQATKESLIQLRNFILPCFHHLEEFCAEFFHKEIVYNTPNEIDQRASIFIVKSFIHQFFLDLSSSFAKDDDFPQTIKQIFNYFIKEGAVLPLNFLTTYEFNRLEFNHMFGLKNMNKERQAMMVCMILLYRVILVDILDKYYVYFPEVRMMKPKVEAIEEQAHKIEDMIIGGEGMDRRNIKKQYENSNNNYDSRFDEYNFGEGDDYKYKGKVHKYTNNNNINYYNIGESIERDDGKVSWKDVRSGKYDREREMQYERYRDRRYKGENRRRKKRRYEYEEEEDESEDDDDNVINKEKESNYENNVSEGEGESEEERKKKEKRKHHHHKHKHNESSLDEDDDNNNGSSNYNYDTNKASKTKDPKITFKNHKRIVMTRIHHHEPSNDSDHIHNKHKLKRHNNNNIKHKPPPPPPPLKPPLKPARSKSTFDHSSSHSKRTSNYIKPTSSTKKYSSNSRSKPASSLSQSIQPLSKDASKVRPLSFLSEFYSKDELPKIRKELQEKTERETSREVRDIEETRQQLFLNEQPEQTKLIEIQQEVLESTVKKNFNFIINVLHFIFKSSLDDNVQLYKDTFKEQYCFKLLVYHTKKHETYNSKNDNIEFLDNITLHQQITEEFIKNNYRWLQMYIFNSFQFCKDFAKKVITSSN